MVDSSDGIESVDTTSTESSSTPGSPAEPVHAVAAIPEENVRQTEVDMSVIGDDGDDSDASMSADSDDSDEDDAGIISQAPPYEPDGQSPMRTNAPVQGTKRKLSASSGHSGSVVRSAKFEYHKKMKTDDGLSSFWTSDGRLKADRSLLPAEIWHHIFTFVPPKALGRLLRINKGFNAFLDPSSSHKPPFIASLSKTASPLRQPDFIWQSSRRLYRPGLPTPFEGFTEVQMWRLACSTTCQFCGKKSTLISSGPVVDQWHSGPGMTGVRPIWLFKVRSCGSCLVQQSIKEIDLLLSSSVPSPLMAAVPFIFLTNQQDVVSATSLSSGQQPATVQITKYYLKAGVEEIKQEFFKVKAMGAGTAEEWLKGLEARGKDWRNEASRWERWELNGGLQKMRGEEAVELFEVISKAAANDPLGTALGHLQRNNGVMVRAENTIPLVSEPARTAPLSFAPQPSPSAALPAGTFAPLGYGGARSQTPLAYQPRPFQTRQERTKEEVMELKAARKSEIERRCLLLEPPITPGVLGHMASFRAALQIIKPFNNNAWEMLKPRLLIQRADAEVREEERLAHIRAVQAQFDLRRAQDGQLREAKESSDQDWEIAQAPLKARIAGFADEVIHEAWAGGQKVNAATAPQFAAQVLLYIRKRFYAEIAQDDAIIRAQGREPHPDPINGPYTRIITLENMKWVFDMKIKPLTEPHRKELFLCRACEGSKYYGFEGVIQHYAAKHTSALSMGSIVVHWRAEWPEEPLFNSDPLNHNPVEHDLGNDTSLHDGMKGLIAPPSNFNSHTTVIPAPPTTQNHVAYTQPQVSTYAGAQGATSTYPYQNQPPNSYPSYQSTGVAYLHPIQDGQYGSSQPGYAASQTPQTFPINTAEHHGAMPSQGGAPASQFFPQPATQPVPGTYHPPVQPLGLVRTEEYRTRLLEVARSANSTWKSTNGVKEMTGSVRVYVILFHVLKDFREKYEDDPPLAMIIDGLSNNKDMRPVRNINGLACRACKLEESYQNNTHARPPKGAKSQEKKLLSFPQLLNHFQAIHIAGVDGPPQYEWGTDMVELPEKKKISALSRAQGMDEYKLQLVKEALPLSFIVTPPPVDYSEQGSEYKQYQQSMQDTSYDDLPPSRDNHDAYYTQLPPAEHAFDHRQNGPSDSTTATRVSVDYSAQASRSEGFGPGGAPQQPADYYGENAYETIPSRSQGRKVPDEAYLEGPSYYGSAANLSELLANPSLRNPPSQLPADASPRLVASAPDTAPPVAAPIPVSSNAAERFLQDFDPAETADMYHRKTSQQQRAERDTNYAHEQDRAEYQNDGSTPFLPQGHERQIYLDVEQRAAVRPVDQKRQAMSINSRAEYPMPPQSHRKIIYEYDDGYAPQPGAINSRHEPIDYQYESEEEVIYVDQHGRRVPPPAPRYAQLEPVRLSHPRPRSRSPIMYADPQSVRYRDHDEGPRRIQPDQYRSRATHGQAEDIQYERVPRQEYYPAYDEPTIRRRQYEEQPQYLRSEDPNVEYVMRRPPRQQERLPYDDLQPMVGQGTSSPWAPPRPGPGAGPGPEEVYEDEEYDPRNPAPLPPQPIARHGRFQ